MRNIDDGGQAFPQSVFIPNRTEGYFHAEAPAGMSLRDWFAGQALLGIISKAPYDTDISGRDDKEIRIARGAYSYADEMLRIRSESNGQNK